LTFVDGDCNGWENVVGIEGEVGSEERGFACGGWWLDANGSLGLCGLKQKTQI
jgi:hypothetical protein